jgi:hypothetical protein
VDEPDVLDEALGGRRRAHGARRKPAPAPIPVLFDSFWQRMTRGHAEDIVSNVN